MTLPEIGSSARIQCGDFTLDGRFVSAHTSATASVLLFHGIGDRLHYWSKVQKRLAQAGCNSLVFHYSGSGNSSGTTTQQNLQRNARSAYTWLRERTPATPIVLLGSSLGTGLACETAGTLQPAPAGLVLVEAYTSLREAAKRVARPLGVLGWLMPDVWISRENVARLRIPLFIIHSSADELFPAAMAEELYAAATAGGAEVELKVFPEYSHGATHLQAPQDYWEAVIAFVQRAAQRHPKES